MLWMDTFKINLPMAVSGKYKNTICIYQIQIKLHGSTTEFKKTGSYRQHAYLYS